MIDPAFPVSLRLRVAVEMIKGLLSQDEAAYMDSICRDMWDKKLVTRAYVLADMVIEEDSQNPREEVLGNG